MLHILNLVLNMRPAFRFILVSYGKPTDRILYTGGIRRTSKAEASLTMLHTTMT